MTAPVSAPATGPSSGGFKLRVIAKDVFDLGLEHAKRTVQCPALFVRVVDGWHPEDGVAVEHGQRVGAGRAVAVREAALVLPQPPTVQRTVP